MVTISYRRALGYLGLWAGRKSDTVGGMDHDGELDAGEGTAADETPAVPQPPHETVALPSDTVIEPGELDGEPHETSFSAEDELQDVFPAETLATPLGADGLPDHSLDPVIEGALAFTIQNVTCIADERQYVELFHEELLARGWRVEADGGQVGGEVWVPPEYARLQIYAKLELEVRHKYDESGAELKRLVFEPGEVGKRWGELFANDVPVRPVREACSFYRRQHFGREAQPDPREDGHHLFYLMCSHPNRRSIAGAAMSLNNQAIYGCDFREPYDDDSVRFMDAVYDKKLRERPDLVRLPMFNFSGDEVIVPDDDGVQPGSIFDP